MTNNSNQLPLQSAVTAVHSDVRRLLGYIAPYWRRLVLVLVLSLIGTGLSLLLPYLTRILIDRALLGRDTGALVRVVLAFAALTIASFALNVVSGLRYTRVSAEILFDMHANHVATSARNTVQRADAIVSLAKRIQAATAASDASTLVSQLVSLTNELMLGKDADADGKVTWKEGEGGLQQCDEHARLITGNR